MKLGLHQSVIVATLLLLALAALVAGCMGAGEEADVSEELVAAAQSTTATVPPMGLVLDSMDAEALSTFQRKDPFIQQAQPAVTLTTASTVPGGGVTSSTGYSPGTTWYTTTSKYTTTTYHSGSTTTTKPTSTTTTTAPHRHTLKVLSIGVVSGAAAVTFQVDNSIYKDKHKGDVVSSSWGQIQVLDINTSSKVVTLLQGSETLDLAVGALIYE